MEIRRRRFMHLIGSHGLGISALPWLVGCGDDASHHGQGSSDGSTTGGSSGTAGGSTSGSSGLDDGSTSTDGSTGTEGSTGEPAECTEPWWLCGNYAPVEEHEAFDLPVMGSLPASLEGLYVRNGPNPFTGTSTHWFNGDGMVHGVSLQGGQAPIYRARYVQTEIIGTTPTAPSDAGHPANTSIISHAGHLLTLAESGQPYALRPADLSTVGHFDYGRQLVGSMTAHPKVDPTTGDLLFFGYEVLVPLLRFHHVDAAGMLLRSEEIPLPASSMMHDFQITQSYVVFLDYPVVFDLDLAIAGSVLPFRWAPENGARLGVMPRDGGAADVVWVEIDVGFAFHTFNAYEDPAGNIVLDAVWYPEMWVKGPNDFGSAGIIVRYTIDPVAGTAVQEVVSEIHGEFPCIDLRRRSLPHRYGYGVSSSQGGAGMPSRTIIKYDLSRGLAESHELPDGLVVDELIFVPDSPTAGEDEGWLLGYAYDPSVDRSQLVVLDATDLGAGPVARVMLPTRVPHGFHGTWVPGG